MAVLGVLASALTTHAPHPIGLFIDNIDYVLEMGAAGTNYGVPPETVDLEEQGPDGVSSLSFTIDDPSNEIVITEGQVVRMHDFVADLPLFLGFVQDWTVKVWGLGRRFDVKCTGIEALLDWIITSADITYTNAHSDTDVTFWGGGSGTTPLPGIQTVLIAAGFDLRMVLASTGNSSLATPIGIINGTIDLTIPAGSSLREAVRSAYATNVQNLGFYKLTVDFWGNVRVTHGVAPTDYAALTVVDTTAGAPAAEGIEHETDMTGVVHRVFVKGGAPAGTGLVTDGTAVVPGQVAYLSAPTAMSAGSLANFGGSYLAGTQGQIRGTIPIEDWQPLTNIRAASRVTITDSIIGLSAQTYIIMSIRKTFHGTGRQDWVVTYGGLPPAATTLLRRWTRDLSRS